MRIGIDGKKAASDANETGRALRSVIMGLADNYPENEFYLYVPKITRDNFIAELEAFHNIRMCYPAPSGFKGELWRAFGQTNNLPADKIDIYHGIDGQLPLNIQMSGIQSVVSISKQNLCSEENKGLKGAICRYKLKKSLHNSSLILVENAEAKEAVLGNYDVAEDKIVFPDSFGENRGISAFLMKVYEHLLENKERKK